MIEDRVAAARHQTTPTRLGPTSDGNRSPTLAGHARLGIRRSVEVFFEELEGPLAVKTTSGGSGGRCGIQA